MVTTAEDIQWVRAHLVRLADQLKIAVPPLGAMIETPAAALSIDLLAPHADFFSIGTNDLAQYTLAADRSHAQLAQHYPVDAPAVFRLVAIAAHAAREQRRPLSVCGELAGMPDTASQLVACGVTILSMAARSIASVYRELSRTGSDPLV
jgi:phosphoenolpyruvate-protein kinase (PTS system EI component)